MTPVGYLTVLPLNVVYQTFTKRTVHSSTEPRSRLNAANWWAIMSTEPLQYSGLCF